MSAPHAAAAWTVEAREQEVVDREARDFKAAVVAAREALPAPQEFINLRSYISTVSRKAGVGAAQAKWALSYLKSLDEADYRLGVGVTRSTAEH